MTLSTNAQKLYEALKAGPIWEENAIDVLFPKPLYVGTMDPNYSEAEKEKIQREFWQRDANLYGAEQIRPVLGTSVKFIPTANYSDITGKAWKELKAAGLGYSKNSGFNTYSYHLKK